MNSRKIKDTIIKVFIYISVIIACSSIIGIIGYSLFKGLPALSIDFIIGDDGILPMIVSTLYTVAISLAVSIPIGIMAAIYLQEYAKPGRFVNIIRLATQSLSGVPSIVFGLFGLAFFVRLLGFQVSLLSAGLTLAVMNLPVIIRSTEEALKSVPNSYREGSLGLGASKIRTIWRVVLPSALPGILSATILAIGRIVGESAPVLMTAGLLSDMPSGIFDGGQTLTVHLYLLAQEAFTAADFEAAFATATVLIIIVLIVNITARLIVRALKRT
ncbi:phosphate ABC transporter permease PstA [Culicoidibacter larvae]|uniref:Phosphate transport system permease protein PstA n=1 Tax=Culicoidibacter larvae TaxID=2579976 RepID=A0A5R8QHC9_9FIRM|nr:phosphate ABC transporter permease PstA [Culicoidibacter larvae]TLG77194.1 phosphate ABC transporter permease PstA [Culicoidibacter larvae]